VRLLVCQDHSPSLPRRQFLHGAGALAGAALLAGRAPAASAAVRPRPRPPARPVTFDGTSAFSNAMHIHSSFSEFTGSMQSHLYQATLNEVDVLWWTDHAYTIDSKPYRDVVHFTSLNEEKPAAGQGNKPWTWVRRESGPNGAASTGGIVTTPCSPNDPVSGGALALTAQSTSTQLARYGYLANASPDGWNYRDNLNGQSLSIDVMLEPGWSRGYLEILVDTSYHQASGGRQAGTYSLSYRITPSGTAHRSASQRTGVVVTPVTADGQTWTTITITPADDIAALWPDLDSRDFALYELYLRASSTGDTVTGYFDYLRFDRALDGGELFAQQADMAEALAPQFPAVTQYQGLELSLGLPHVNWFGSNVAVPTLDGIGYKKFPAWLEQKGIPAIHQAGGLASWNHPFGYSWTKVLKTQAQQDTLLQQVAAQLLATGVYACDILEVGYPKRAGVDLTHHVALWDVLSRNAVFVTGNGASDDHWATDWAGLTWNWATSTWSASTAQSDLLAALAAGRAYTGSLAAPPVALDLLVDSEVPMGAVSVSSLTSRSLAVTAAGLPTGSTLQVLQGAVDYAGASGLASNTVPVGSFGPGDLDSNGQATLSLDTSAGSFVRTAVVDSTGTVRALSNPVWLLDTAPPNGIPAPRAA
jgi:hypothetical protein